MSGKKKVAKRPTARSERTSSKVGPKTTEALDSVHSSAKLREAAIKIFSQYGYHGTTTKLIAKEACVNEALISRHFGGKQGLFIDVVNCHAMAKPDLFPFEAQETLAGELIHTLNFLVESHRCKNEFMRLVLAHGLTDPSFLKNYKAQFEMPTSAPLRARLKLFQKQKKLSANADLQAIEQFMRSQIFTVSFFSQLLGLVDEEHALEEARYAIRVFCAGLETL